ncbi:MAG: chemotaxis protein CheA [Oceanospirillaceae bacterium]|jgi:two-component system chemotaxis sensor kinase CheA|nr:chemotaxis protein CheA [Oceanospirillaceae bacterium]MBT4442901.1 chemotaxis protein CheA [Oceanospirillaceae bacterium]
MSIDLSQFHAVFFEESFEGLELMETSLLELDVDAPDSEQINTIFRAAHSIKGGSGTFGFVQVAEFTHILETLLDKIRDGDQSIDPDGIELFLQSVDCLRGLLEALQTETEPDTTRAQQLAGVFQAVLDGGTYADSANVVKTNAITGAPLHAASPSPAPASSDDSVANAGTRKQIGFSIVFEPEEDMLKGGNDPVRMLRELATLGDLISHANTDQVPDFDQLVIDHCYLSWDIELVTNCDIDDIEEVFEWVEDECELSITPIYADISSAAELHYSNSQNHAIDKKMQQATAEGQRLVMPSGPLPSLDNLQLASPGDVTNNGSDATPAEASAALAPPKPTAPAAAKPKAAKVEASSIRVGIDKVDSLINLVGELVITQSMLGQMGSAGDSITDEHIGNLREGLVQLEQNTRELQDSVMRIRMLPISFTFNRFPRIVRDISIQLGKQVQLELSGENTELDKTVMEKISDPMVHLIRNALDHGIEMPEQRKAAGKPEMGTIVLNAFHQGGNIVIEMTDDGGGIDTERLLTKARNNGLVGENEKLTQEQKLDLLFSPGLSTVEEVSDLSGRGVGMDVVRRNIQELSGSVEVSTEMGVGSTFRIRLPLTLAILDGQLVTVADQTYIFPLVSISESLQIDSAKVNNVAGGSDVYNLRDEYIPILCLDQLFGLRQEAKVLQDSLLVVVESEGQKVGVVVDELLAQQQVVIKSLEENYTRVQGVSGATILGDGTVAMIVDALGLSGLAGSEIAAAQKIAAEAVA